MEDVWPCLDSVCLDIDEEVDGLRTIAIEDTVICGGLDKGRGRVLMPESGEDGADVEGVKSASRCERRGFVADIKGPVVEPYVGFDTDAAV